MLSAQRPSPSLADPHFVIGGALEALRFPEDVLISESTRRHRVLMNPGAYSGPWSESPHDVRFLDRPMDCLHTTSKYAIVVVMGPSQTGKSEIGNNWQLHSILYDQADLLFVAPTKDLINVYVTTQFEKMLDLAVSIDGKAGILRERQLGGVGSDNINLKRFMGCDFHFLWPGGPTFRAKPFPRARGDDFEEFAAGVKDQGSALGLFEGRMASFAAYGRTKLYLNSSPFLGKSKGTEQLVATGTDERWYVDCLQCGAPFPMTFDHMRYDQEGTPEDAAASVRMECPIEDCGHHHLQSDKRALMATGRWVGRGEIAVSRRDDDEGKTGDLVITDRATFRLDGVMGFRPWEQIAKIARAAELTYQIEQDAGDLITLDNTVIGRNYVPRGDGEPSVTEDVLYKRARNSTYRMGEVPPGVQCLILTIDQQVNRFEYAVWGIGADFRVWLIDRGAEMTIREGGRERALQPFKRAEDWSVLHSRLLSKTYPMQGAPHLRMKIMNTSVDTGGLENATDNAFAWWHSMVAGDVGSGRPRLPTTAITLLKGGNKPKGRLLPPPTIDAKRQLKDAPQAELFIPNVNRYKDIADVRLKRADDGPGCISFPKDLPEEMDPKTGEFIIPYLAELRAETNIDGQWTREDHRANETWDLYIQACAVVTRFGGNDHSFAWVPDWARPPKSAPKELPPPAATQSDDDGQTDPAPVQRQSVRVPARPTRRRGVRTVRAR